MTNLLDEFELTLLEKSSIKKSDLIEDLIKLVSNEIKHAESTLSKILGSKISALQKQEYLDNWINTDLKQAFDGLNELKVEVTDAEQIFSTVKIKNWKTRLMALEKRCTVLRKFS